MGLTSQLGTASSRLGNIELGLVAAPAGPAATTTAQSYMPEIKQGPPMKGAPWVGRSPIQDNWQPSPNTVLTVNDRRTSSEIKEGPPMRGAPWVVRVPVAEAGNLRGPIPPPPPPVPPPFMPEVRQGPPMRGAPWLFVLPPAEGSLLFIPPAPKPPVYEPEFREGPPMQGAPWRKKSQDGQFNYQLPPPLPAPSPSVYPTEIFAGPPMRGAPWLGRLPIDEGTRLVGLVNVPPVPIPVGPGRGKNRPFVARVPDVTDERRLGRVTDQVSSILNSLIGQGILVQTGIQVWTLRGAAFISTRSPLATDDATIGANPGNIWINTTNSTVWFCVSNAKSAAVWITVSGPFGLTGTFP